MRRISSRVHDDGDVDHDGRMWLYIAIVAVSFRTGVCGVGIDDGERLSWPSSWSRLLS